MNNTPLCGIIGAGRAGGAIARAMHRAGYRFAWVASRTPEVADRLAAEIGAGGSGAVPPADTIVDILIIATPDSAIEDAARDAVAAGCIGTGTVACHLSGARGVECLDAARTAGASVMAFHPAQTFAQEADPAAVFAGIWFDMEGDAEACDTGARIAGDLGARAVRLNHEARGVAHLAMTIASNYTVALVHLACQLMVRHGIGEETAAGMLGPLVEATAGNIRRRGIVQALTGPVSRGDVGVVRDHLAMLAAEPGNADALYRMLAREALEIARERGTIDGAAVEVDGLLRRTEPENHESS